MKTLLFFSGGKDSAYVLYKLLTETDDEVTAIHFYTNNKSVPVVLEDKFYPRISSLVQELKKIRDFNFIKKEVELKDVTKNTSFYYTFCINYAAPFLNDGTYDRISTGRTWEAQDQKFLKNLSGSSPATVAGKRLFNQLVTRGELWNPLVSHDFVQNFNRYHVLTSLPENIKALTFTCTFPDIKNEEMVECGICYKCLWDQKVLELIEEGYNSDQIDEWRRLKALQYGNGNDISAPMRYWLPVEMDKGIIHKALDSKEKIRRHVQTNLHYSLQSYSSSKKSTIWDFSTSSE